MGVRGLANVHSSITINLRSHKTTFGLHATSRREVFGTNKLVIRMANIKVSTRLPKHPLLAVLVVRSSRGPMGYGWATRRTEKILRVGDSVVEIVGEVDARIGKTKDGLRLRCSR